MTHRPETAVTTMGSSGIHRADIVEIAPGTGVVVFHPPLPESIGSLATLGEQANRQGLRVDVLPTVPLTDALILSDQTGDEPNPMAFPSVTLSILEAANEQIGQGR